MKTRAIQFLGLPVVALLLLPATGAASQEGGYASMEGAGPVHTVFDFRVGDPDVAASHLNLIHSMVAAPSMTREGEEPEIVVVFIGPAVDLLSDEGAVGEPDAVAEAIASMEADGVRFEVCMTTAQALDISAESINPDVVQVGNGWISLIGYQQNDYALVANL